MESAVAGGQVAAGRCGAPYLRPSRAGERDHCAGSVARALNAYETYADPGVTRLRDISPEAHRATVLESEKVRFAVVIEIAHRQAAPDARDRQPGLGRNVF